MHCSIKRLPQDLLEHAMRTAHRVNPVNRPMGIVSPQRIALLTTKYWGAGGVHLTVGFMEPAAADLAAKILKFMNLWGSTANVQFSLSNTSPQVRVSRDTGGYWSYLGTDILHAPPNQQTMNLEGFTMQTPDAEFYRVVCHETGHTLGFPHEHMRLALVQKLDPIKTIAYFMLTQGWSPQEIQQQVLTPLDENSLMDTPADQDSIMCYQLPGSITRDGQPIRGGVKINPNDAAFAGKVYPVAAVPPSPPPLQPPPVSPAVGTRRIITISGLDTDWRIDKVE